MRKLPLTKIQLQDQHSSLYKNAERETGTSQLSQKLLGLLLVENLKRQTDPYGKVMKK